MASPLLDETSIEGARGILINFTGGADLSIHEVEEAARIVQEAAHEEANIIFGAVIDESLQDEVRITVIATGFTERKEATLPSSKVVDRIALAGPRGLPARRAMPDCARGRERRRRTWTCRPSCAGRPTEPPPARRRERWSVPQIAFLRPRAADEASAARGSSRRPRPRLGWPPGQAETPRSGDARDMRSRRGRRRDAEIRWGGGPEPRGRPARAATRSTTLPGSCPLSSPAAGGEPATCREALRLEARSLAAA